MPTDKQITVTNVRYENDGDDVSALPTSYTLDFIIEDGDTLADIEVAVTDHISEVSGYLVAHCEILIPD
jgi:hypothetical protein